MLRDVFWLIFWLDYQSSSGKIFIDILTSIPGDCSFGFPRMMLGLPRPHCCRSLLAESAVRKWEVVSESGQSPGHRLPSLRCCHHAQPHPQDLTPTLLNKVGRAIYSYPNHCIPIDICEKKVTHLSDLRFRFESNEFSDKH